MKWFEQKDILSYLIDSYAGVDGQKRQFIWEEANGDTVIGNTRAFTDHISEKFHLNARPTAWIDVHRALRSLGEVVSEHAPKTRIRGSKFRNQEPEVRILKRRAAKSFND